MDVTLSVNLVIAAAEWADVSVIISGGLRPLDTEQDRKRSRRLYRLLRWIRSEGVH